MNESHPLSVGIHGIGIYLPEPIRRNDWWPERIVDTWREGRQAKNLVRAEQDPADPLTAGARQTFAGLAEWADDPFKGAVERRVMPTGMKPSDMEVEAARDAMARAGVGPGDIDLLLVFSQLPDQLMLGNATKLHHRLGLPTQCFSMSTENACNAFMQQLTLAEQMIRGGRVRRALLIQSSGAVHACRPEDPHSAWFGDGATAAVVGPVSEGRGILGTCHKTDGSFHDALMTGSPGRNWWEGDPIYVYTPDRNAARRMLMAISDIAKDGVHDALRNAGLSPEQVDFYATHQSTRWFRKVTQDYIGLPNARSFDSYAWTGSLAACNVPFMLGMGEREGLLADGQVAALYTGGSGITWSGMVIRWGR